MPTVESCLDLVRANQMLLSNRPIRPVQALYIHGLSDGMLGSGFLFNQAARIYHGGGKNLVITFNGYEGDGADKKNTRGEMARVDYYRRELLDRRVVKEDLIPTKPAYNTRQETDALIDLATEQQWKRVGILTVAYHYPRSFICLIQGMKSKGYWFEAFPMPPLTTDWQYPMYGSQYKGEVTSSFEETMRESIKVLDTYIPKGFGCTLGELFHYLKHKPAIVASQSFEV